jgi:hypothetical protein
MIRMSELGPVMLQGCLATRDENGSVELETVPYFSGLKLDAR